MPFLLSAKNLFLTYPRLLASPQEVEHALRHGNSFLSGKAFTLTIGCELGTGDPDSPDNSSSESHFHVHCLLRFERKQTIRRASALDILGHHGNYQCAYDTDHVHRYCHKEEGDESERWTGCGDGTSVLHLCEGAGGPTGGSGGMGWGPLLDQAQSRCVPPKNLLLSFYEGRL